MKRLLVLFSFLTAVTCHLSPAYATQVQEVTSPGGIKAWLVEEHALPLVAIKMAFRNSGTAYDPKGKEGRATMTAALLLEGAGDMDSRAFNEALENDAIELNFATDEDSFRASLVTLSEHKEKAFSYLGLALTHPRFDDSATERVRSQTLSTLAQEEKNPSYILHRQWEQAAFGQHPYANPALGSKESVSALARSDFADVAQHYLTHENILIAVVGDMTVAELSHLLDAHFATLPAHYAADVTVPEVSLPSQAKQRIVQNPIPQTMAIFATQGVKRDDPRYYAAYVMNYIIGGADLRSRLAQEIRIKRGLAYSVYSMEEPMIHGAVWKGGFATRNAQVGSAVTALHSTLQEFADYGPTDKEMQDAKTYITGSFVLGLDSNADIANYLISMQLYHLGRDYLDKRNGLIEAVSKDDVKAIAKKLTDPSHLVMVMVGQPDLSAGK